MASTSYNPSDLDQKLSGPKDGGHKLTTLVALPTKDAVVMGCDSLATVARPMIDPRLLIRSYFDEEGHIRTDDDGKPLLSDINQALDLANEIPFDHMTDVDKLFSLEPLHMGAMFTGITSLGDRTVKGLLAEFKAQDPAFKASATNFTVKSLGTRLLTFLRGPYLNQFGDWHEELRPVLQLILAGYNKSGPHPQVAKIDVTSDKVTLEEPPFWPVFGGQSREIERIVYGIDTLTFVRIENRLQGLLKQYGQQVAEANGLDPESMSLPQPGKDLRMFTDSFRIPGVAASWGDFSEQNAIDCVAFFVRIMREAQRFSARMPTVGGAIHVALVDREMGFRFISRREYSHEDHRVSRDGSRTAAASATVPGGLRLPEAR